MGSGVSFTDFQLGLTLKKYGRKMRVLTTNHKDFPTSLYDRHHVITVEGSTWVETLATYSFSERKYEEVMTKMLSNDEKMLAKQSTK